MSYQFLDKLRKMMPYNEVAPKISNCERFASYVMQKMELTARRICIGKQGCSLQYSDQNINLDMTQPYACPDALRDDPNAAAYLSSMCLRIRYFCFNGTSFYFFFLRLFVLFGFFLELSVLTIFNLWVNHPICHHHELSKWIRLSKLTELSLYLAKFCSDLNAHVSLLSTE